MVKVNLKSILKELDGTDTIDLQRGGKKVTLAERAALALATGVSISEGGMDRLRSYEWCKQLMKDGTIEVSKADLKIIRLKVDQSTVIGDWTAAQILEVLDNELSKAS